jgi:hypothetical protein
MSKAPSGTYQNLVPTKPQSQSRRLLQIKTETERLDEDLYA